MMKNKIKHKEIYLKVGDRFPTNTGDYFRIMSITEGYVMARRKGCAPFCEGVGAFILRLKEYCDIII